MKSIQSQLLTGLLVGQSVLWILAAVGVWYSVRARLYAEFDNELRFTTAALRFHIRSRSLDEQIERRWPEFLAKGSGWYFQSWNSDGSVRVRSANLSNESLPVLQKTDRGYPPIADYPIEDFRGPGGQALRGVSVENRLTSPRFLDRDRSRYATTLVVAHSREALDRKLAWLGVAVGLACLLAAGATTLLVRISVRRSLRPLNEMGEKAASIDVSNLSTRFNPDGLPSELQPISSQLNDLMNRIEDGIGRERRFSSDLEHELRTPLAELKAIADLLVRWPEESGEKRHKEILGIVTQMEGIMESLLMLSRWESDADSAVTEEFEVGSVIDSCWRKWTKKAGEKQIKSEVEISSGTLLETDPALFQLILNNLISNAVEYTPEGGSILIESESVESPFTITNSVNGLKQEDVKHLTERFWRHDESRTGVQHSGLGLSVASTCAKRIQFELKAELDEAEKLLRVHLQSTDPGL
ncbi:MAG: hypothetical protein HKN23_20690 [Verrucomicrobiales bacterium]|nr:hypothetical protein [Verrucomicrobiales bacterium]